MKCAVVTGVQTCALPIWLASVLICTAQASGVSFSWPDYGTILLATLLLSGASSGIPGGGLVKVLIIVQAFNLPLEIAAVVGGVYRVIDIGNTTVNMLGDMVGKIGRAHV